MRRKASRFPPFTSKATAVPLAKAAARISLGATIAELRAEGLLPALGDGGTLPLDAPISVKEAVMPWSRFRDIHGRGVDTVLGPEMRSTGEVMGIDSVFGTAYAKSQAGAYGPLPTKGRAFISVANRDKRTMIFPARELVAHGFELMATSGTAEVLKRNGINATVVRKLDPFPSAADPEVSAGGDPRHRVLAHWTADPAQPADTTLQQGVQQACATVSGAAVGSFLQTYPATSSPEPNGA